MNTKVAIVKCDTYEQQTVSSRVKEVIDLAGGIISFVRPQSRVLVKPNLLMPIGPSAGINTHPEVVRAVIRVLKSIDCKVFLGDGPCALKDIPDKMDEVYETSGMTRVCWEEGVELLKFEQKRWRKRFPLAAFLDECDHVVNVPKFKTHNMMVLTGAIKNLFGLVWRMHKIEMHKKYFYPPEFAGILVDIYEEVKPALTVVDGIVAMEGDGPATSGKLRKQNIIVAGKDCVAIDSVLASIMGLEPKDILTTKEAAERGLGEADIRSIIIEGERLKDIITSPFVLPASSSLLKKILPKPILDMARKMIKFYPCVDRKRCIRCAACVKGCPNKAISMGEKGIAFDYTKCISCFCCQEFCPEAAIKVRKNWFMKIAGL
ncbi:MAG: DUF362 domain-containing protein [Candidatus Omnitrophota bacterium]